MAVLNLEGGASASHFFDCHTEVGTPSDLTWSRENGLQRFPTESASIIVNGQNLTTLRLDMAPPGEPNVRNADTGIYTCRNTQTGQSASLNITGGASTFSL